MYKFTIDAPDCIQAKHKGAWDTFTVCDTMTEYARLPHDGRTAEKWNGGLSRTDAARLAMEGDLSAVAASDEYLARLESQVIPSGRKAWIDDVAGAVPNVGAFLSGSPCAMRYRKKTQDDSAPIGIVYNGLCSAAIDVKDMRKRGTVALALVRLLSVRRPVELWYMVGYDAAQDASGNRRPNGSTWALVRIDSSPLDIARAAFMLTHPSATRMLGYGYLKTVDAGIGGGHFPYGGGDNLSATETRAVVAQGLPHLTDILAIPGIISSDPMLKDPEGWLRAQVALYAGGES